jgi:hypothetical protein
MVKSLRRHIDETCAAWALLLFVLLLRKVLIDLSAAPKSRPKLRLSRIRSDVAAWISTARF